MLKPDWASPYSWSKLKSTAENLAAEFADSLPHDESMRLLNDDQLFELAGEQIQQKLVSALETYRAKGIHAGTKAN